jgi:hypothetical protein
MKKYQIFMKKSDEEWTLIEECMDDLVLADRMIQLRSDGGEYKAEERDGNSARELNL